jgi:hypothetical protein
MIKYTSKHQNTEIEQNKQGIQENGNRGYKKRNQLRYRIKT